MDLKLLEIQPRELRFEFELLKKSSCLVHLMNNTDHLVAFKVKTTSPRRYSVEPSIGAIEPKSISNLTVIMHAPIVLPPNMQSRDKFLIQSIALPMGTTDIDPDMFTKDSGRQMEEVKLRVVLISTLPSPMLISNGGAQKQEVTHQLGKDFEQSKSTKNAQNVGYGKDVERLKSNKEIEELNLRNAELQHKLREVSWQ
ncbi:hypothetical protein Scep_030582 [Stephania cephalantha]|uniref:MSP domain-containing protein n=1 Tax=Stephania cephalantha TaxID=152367 RepID=A0AAP0E019_9MAGN